MTFRIESVTAFVAVDPDDDSEGIVGACIGPMGEMVPLIAADDARMQSLIPLAKEIAKEQKLYIKLIRFTHREEVANLNEME
jgi:hypothetical protein